MVSARVLEIINAAHAVSKGSLLRTQCFSNHSSTSNSSQCSYCNVMGAMEHRAGLWWRLNDPLCVVPPHSCKSSQLLRRALCIITCHVQGGYHVSCRFGGARSSGMTSFPHYSQWLLLLAVQHSTQHAAHNASKVNAVDMCQVVHFAKQLP